MINNRMKVKDIYIKTGGQKRGPGRVGLEGREKCHEPALGVRDRALEGRGKTARGKTRSTFNNKYNPQHGPER